MKLYFTDSFRRDYRYLPANIQKVLDKQLLRLAGNARHPSLRAKKMTGRQNTWEARVSKSYRLTFQKLNGIIVVRRIGTHDILQNP